MKHKLIFVLFALIANVCFVSAVGHNKVKIGELYYFLFSDDQVASVADGNYSAYEKVEIPANITYRGITYQVTTITNFAFCNCHNLVSITIPNTIKGIGESAFESCWNLTSITIPASVNYIEFDAFKFCMPNPIICMAATPPDLGEDTMYGRMVFEGVDCSNIILYVPENSVGEYMMADQWKEFNIQPIK